MLLLGSDFSAQQVLRARHPSVLVPDTREHKHPKWPFSGHDQRTGTAEHTTAWLSVWAQELCYLLFFSVKPPGSRSEWTSQNAFEGYHYHKDYEGWKCVFCTPGHGSELKSAQRLEGTACSNVNLALMAVLSVKADLSSNFILYLEKSLKLLWLNEVGKGLETGI